jgi:hypothetical protein
VEVWSEKGTVRGTLKPILDAYGVAFRVLHGYGSATAVHDAAEDTLRDDRPLTALYLGDWDPSGLHMSEVDLPARLDRYAYGRAPEIVRVALTAADVADPDLPSFPASTKTRDPRHAWFVSRYGSTAWELDALSPVVLRDRVETEIVDRIEHAAWTRSARAEAAEHESIASVLTTWRTISTGEP